MLAIDGLELGRPDFLKIDIDGMEMEALEGAKATIARYNPIPLIEKVKSNERRLRDWLRARGYAVYNLGLNLLAVHSTDPVGTKLTFIARRGKRWTVAEWTGPPSRAPPLLSPCGAACARPAALLTVTHTCRWLQIATIRHRPPTRSTRRLRLPEHALPAIALGRKRWAPQYWATIHPRLSQTGRT